VSLQEVRRAFDLLVSSKGIATQDARAPGDAVAVGQEERPASDPVCENTIRSSAENDSNTGGALDSTLSGIPARIGRYQIRRLLGSGGFGDVYLGYDEIIDRLVAVKAFGMALFVLTGLFGMVQANWLAIEIRAIHTMELLVDALANACALTMLLRVPLGRQWPTDSAEAACAALTT
jgi:hypothetical protein